MKKDDISTFLEQFDKQFKQTDKLFSDIMNCSNSLDQYLKPCGDDLMLLTLKGHLIIESLLEMNLCRLLSIDQLPEEKEDNYPELEFIHKLKLLQAAAVESKPGPNTDLFRVIAKLNKIRNGFAHNLKHHNDTEADIKSLVACYQSKADKGISLGESPPAQLRSCIHKLCAFLFDVRIHFQKIRPV